MVILIPVAQRASEKEVSTTTMAYGVIGNTTVSGTVILGSSPGRPAAEQSAGEVIRFAPFV